MDKLTKIQIEIQDNMHLLSVIHANQTLAGFSPKKPDLMEAQEASNLYRVCLQANNTDLSRDLRIEFWVKAPGSLAAANIVKQKNEYAQWQNIGHSINVEQINQTTMNTPKAVLLALITFALSTFEPHELRDVVAELSYINQVEVKNVIFTRSGKDQDKITICANGQEYEMFESNFLLFIEAIEKDDINLLVEKEK